MEYKKEIIQLAIDEAVTKEERDQLVWSIHYREMEVKKCLRILCEKQVHGEADYYDKNLIELYQGELRLLGRLDYLFN